MKKVLITMGGALKESKFKELKFLKYDKIYYITKAKKELKKTSKIQIVRIDTNTQIKNKISEILEKEKKNTIFYYFSGDTNSKYTVYTQNNYYGTKIDSKIFKQKDSMNKFLGEINEKKNMKCSFSEFNSFSYSELVSILGEKFIIKPTNASSSVSTFTVANSEEMAAVKKKIKKKYDYVLEEYIGGNLYSIDFYCDGKNLFLLNLLREVPFIELMDKDKFSKDFLAQHGEEINKNFLYNLPLRYTLPFSKLNPTEIKFISQIKTKLANIKYKGFIHLEYKLEKKAKKIGFIEWGARLGAYRLAFIRSIYNLDCRNIPQMILKDKDYGLFGQKKGLYFLKHPNPDMNYVGFKINFTQKTNLHDVINNRKDYLEVSYRDYLQDYFKKKFKIQLNNINFIIKKSKGNFLYPFHERNDTRFDFTFSLDDDNFKLFRKNKFKIIENIGFGDYK